MTRVTPPTWNPATQMSDYAKTPLLKVESAQGGWLLTRQGRYFDTTSSWWTKSLGHRHPELTQALIEQAGKFEHVMLAGTTSELIDSLSQKLINLHEGYQHVFYAGDGASAVEVALKMALHTQKLRGQTKKTRFACLENSYHGESALTMSLSDCEQYKAPYGEILQDAHVIRGIPYVNSTNDLCWRNCAGSWDIVMKRLEPVAEELAAVVVEPIVQGAGGMRIYSADFLRRLAAWCKKNDILLIADEIMTGFGRTGKMFAFEHARGVTPDFVCVGKALTGGYLPMSAVLTTGAVYDEFYCDYSEGRNFLHSNTYAGNALGAAVALKHLEILEEQDIVRQVAEYSKTLMNKFNIVSENSNALWAVRGIGAIVAGDIRWPNAVSQRYGFRVMQAGLRRQLLLRPLANTLYWCLPFNTSDEEYEFITDQTLCAVHDVAEEIGRKPLFATIPDASLTGTGA